MAGEAGGEGLGAFFELAVGEGGGFEGGADFGGGGGVGVVAVAEEVGHRRAGGVVGGDPVAQVLRWVGHRWCSSFSVGGGLL